MPQFRGIFLDQIQMKGQKDLLPASEDSANQDPAQALNIDELIDGKVIVVTNNEDQMQKFFDW